MISDFGSYHMSFIAGLFLKVGQPDVGHVSWVLKAVQVFHMNC